MPNIRNRTPFSVFRYYSTDNRGKEFGIAIVKGTFEISETGKAVAANEQAPIIFQDLCYGEVNTSSLWHPSDLVPLKPRTDIIVNATARAPDGRPVPCWECGIGVEGEEGLLVEKRLRVTGPRHWEPRWKLRLTETERRDWRRFRPLFAGWILSEPEPVLEVPLCYELAYGGTIRTGVDDAGAPLYDCDTRNPIGRGLIDREWTDHTTAQPAPQIEAVDEPICEPYRRYTPQSFGPIPPAWDPRLLLGGTYDRNWIDHVWPNWPEDYDFSFHNSAHRDLQFPGYLKGSEKVTLANIGRNPQHSFHLGDHIIHADFFNASHLETRSSMLLDTVMIVDDAAIYRDFRVLMTWRTTFAVGAYDLVEIHLSNAGRNGEGARS